MRENPRAESECSHRRGEEENGTSDSDSAFAPRSEFSAGAHPRCRRPRDGTLPQRERVRGFRIQGARIFPQLRSTRAPAARRRRPCSHAPPCEGISEKFDKFTGFFNKKVEIFGELSVAISMSCGFQGPFFDEFQPKKIQVLCKIQAGYFSTRRFAITILWMSFVPSPTCRRMESR